MKADRFISPTFALLAMIGVSGCDQFHKQQKDRAFERASQAAKEGNFKDARADYEAALDGTSATADAYYRLALIEDDKLHNYPGALHHYQRYLDLSGETDTPQAKDAQRFLKEVKFKLINELSTGAMVSQKDAARIRNENLELNKKITDLRTQVEQLRQQRNAALNQSLATKAKSTPPPPSEIPKIPPGAKTYVVQAGDTLNSIARHFYKNPARWKDILDANYYSLNGKPNLKLGQVLIIPD